MIGIQSGYGNNKLPLWAVVNLYIIFICTSIPGLAISPIMGDLTRIFPGTTQLETQFLTLGPNIAAIPFVFLGGWIGTRFNNVKLTNWTCVFYSIGGAAFFFAPNMITLIILSFAIGICAGILSPLASAFIADMFGGKKRTMQYGYTSAVLNLVLMACTIGTGYLAKLNWRLPFFIYLLPIVPLFFAKGFSKYIKEPATIRSSDAAKINAPKVKYKFSQNVNMPMLVRYCAYYFFITLVIAAISLYLPFRYTNSATAGDLTSILFLGIMASGFSLNWAIRWLKKNVALFVMFFILVGFVLMTVTNEVVLVGVGILLASYFYGVAQPYYYDRLSLVSTRVALTLTMAWFAVMDSIGNVVAPFILDGIAKLFHTSASTHPFVAFQICTYLCAAALVIVIIRTIIVAIKNKEHKGEAPAPVLGDSVNPMPVSELEAKVTAAETTAQAAEATAKAAEQQAAKAEEALHAYEAAHPATPAPEASAQPAAPAPKPAAPDDTKPSTPDDTNTQTKS